MSDFRFGLGDRVNVPNYINVQGQVIGLSDTLAGGKRYLLTWVASLQVRSQEFNAEQMADANAPAPIIKPEVTAASTDDAGETLEAARRKARNLRRKRKPAKKVTKRKR